MSCSIISELGEDSFTLSLKPDCADFVYFLRAYFAFKMGLPFAYSNCSRGAGGAPPRCNERFDILHPQLTRPAPPPEQAMASAAAPPAPTPAAAPPRTFLQQLFSQPQQVQAGGADAARSLPRNRLRRSGRAVASPDILGPWATSFIPVRCARRQTATSPTFTRSR